MKHLLIASAFALAAVTGAQGANEATATGMKLSQSECDALWMKANPSNAAKIGESQAEAYITDVKSVNQDGDGTIEKSEFTNACNKGLMKTAAANTGATPKQDPAAETSDRTPEKRTETPLSQKDSVGGHTSDRSPKN